MWVILLGRVNAGGITGRNGSTSNSACYGAIIRNCYNAGNIIFEENSLENAIRYGIGNIVGFNKEKGILDNCYYLSNNIIGYGINRSEEIMTIYEKNSSQMKTVDFVNQLNTNSYKYDEYTLNNNYPILLWTAQIEINKKPSKLLYEKDKDNLDLNGGKIKIRHNYSNYDTIYNMDEEKFTVSGFDNTIVGIQELTVTFQKEFNANFNIEVVKDEISPILDIQYSTKEITKDNVTVTITANEEIQQVEGWRLGEDKKILTKTYIENAQEEVNVLDIAGNETKANIAIDNIDKIAPQVNIKYSTKEVTNGNVTVTITANEKIQQVEGWRLGEDKKTLTKTYIKNAQEEVNVLDIAGNEAKANITISNIDTTAPEVEVKYSTTKLTNGNVTVNIITNEKIQEVEGWNLSADKKTLTKEFTDNIVEEITIYDLAGNMRLISIEIKNIDKIAPKLDIQYSTKQATKENVTVTITADEKIQQVEGWKQEEDGKTLTKTYTKNTQEEITIFDLAENESKANIAISNIDTTAPEVEIKYSTTKLTNENVTVTIITNEKIQEIEGWNLSADKKTLTKEFIDNTVEEITIYDLVGNKRLIPIEIKNIDKIAPILDIEYSTQEITKEMVTVTIKADKKIQQLEGWELEEDGRTLTKTYLENKQEEVSIFDLAGNEIKANIVISNIDTTAPQVEIKYSTTKLTNGNITVSIITNEKIQEVKDWDLSADKKTLTKEFKNNTKEEIIIYDLAGNQRMIPIEIENIDKLPPELKISYSSKEKTKEVTVVITANEEISQEKGWKLGEDKKTLTKTYTENMKEEIIVYDLAGNKTAQKIEINNIVKDNTESPIKLPKAGETSIIIISIIFIIGIAIILYVKIHALKEVK